MKKEGFTMIDPTKQEKEAMQATIQPLAEYVTEIGMHRSLQDYTRAEILTLIEVVVTNYQDYLFAHFPDNQPPKKKKY
jgi:epoxyqueuosine reductase QueG